MKNPIKDEKKAGNRISDRVFRGGSWSNGAQRVRVSDRSYYDPTGTFDFLGFRIVRNKQ